MQFTHSTKRRTPVSSSKLENLHAMGQEFNERTIRHYFQVLDQKVLTENHGKKWRGITERGIRELTGAKVFFDKVGFLRAKIDQLTSTKKAGTAITDITLIETEILPRVAPMICQVYEAGYSTGTMRALFRPDEKAGGNP